MKRPAIRVPIEYMLENGDSIIIANKGFGKIVLLMQLAREIRSQPDTRLIIFETFPKWIHEFDCIPYLTINSGDVVEKSKSLRGDEIKHALENNKDLLFLLDLEDQDQFSFFMYTIIRYFYRKHYLTAHRYGTDKIKERVVFIIEEAQNLFDSRVIDKKMFNRLRRMISEARNLKINFISASQRLQDLNTKIRGRSKFFFGLVNQDDYELKIRKLQR